MSSHSKVPKQGYAKKKKHEMIGKTYLFKAKEVVREMKLQSGNEFYAVKNSAQDSSNSRHNQSLI